MSAGSYDSIEIRPPRPGEEKYGHRLAFIRGNQAHEVMADLADMAALHNALGAHLGRRTAPDDPGGVLTSRYRRIADLAASAEALLEDRSLHRTDRASLQIALAHLYVELGKLEVMRLAQAAS